VQSAVFHLQQACFSISTSSATPADSYQVTVVFAEIVTSTSSAFLLLPFLLLPLYFLRRKMNSRGIWSAAFLGLILLTAAAFNVGCGGPALPQPLRPLNL